MAKAIAARIETLDEAFLVTLQGFVQAAEADGGRRSRRCGYREVLYQANLRWVVYVACSALSICGSGCYYSLYGPHTMQGVRRS